MDVWSSLAAGKQVKGINRGDVDKTLIANWKRHFTNYPNPTAAPTDLELSKRLEDLDKEKKAIPATMKEDMMNKKVPTASLECRPESCTGAEKTSFLEMKYAMIKRGDPRYIPLHIIFDQIEYLYWLVKNTPKLSCLIVFSFWQRSKWWE